MPRLAWFGWVLAWSTGICGCFSEPVPAAEGGDCREGEQSCACFPNGTCSAELTCHPEASVCIPEGCTPGALDCSCADGACLEPQVCERGVCVQAGGTSEGGDVTTAASTTTGAETDATGPSTSGTPETTSADSSTGGDPTGPDTTDTGAADCDQGDCESCLSCVGKPGNACATEAEQCQGSATCSVIAQCVYECAGLGFCFEPCCPGIDDPGVMQADALSQCSRVACRSTCGNATFMICS